LLGAGALLSDRIAPPTRAAFTAALGAVSAQGGTASCDLVLLGEPPRTIAATLGAVEWEGAPAVAAFLSDVSAQRGVEDAWRRQEREARLAVVSAGLLHDLASLVQVALLQQRLVQQAAAVGHASDPIVPHDLGDALQRMSVLLGELRDVARDRLAPADRGRGSADLVVARVLRRGGYLMPVGVRLEAADLPTLAVAMPAPVLEDVLLNLLTNARDAVAARGGTITVRGEVGPGGLLLHVDDDGPGIAPGLSSRLGQPFVTTKPPGRGTGLGLWMVRTQVEAVGGRFSIGPGPAGGTRATLALPRAD
jgi:signal transduction histidine kinase